MEVVKLSELTTKLGYPYRVRDKMREVHTDIIAFASQNMSNNRKCKKLLVDALNYATYATLQGEYFEYDFTLDEPFSDIPDVSLDEMKRVIKGLYVGIDDIIWDLDENDVSSKDKSKKLMEKQKAIEEIRDTPKEHLYLRAPIYPRFDITKYSLFEQIGHEKFYIHPSLPIIPEKQNDVSITTDVSKMTDKELLRLYPNRLIHTRAEVMYEPIDGVTMDKDLGLLIPIEGYTDEQIRDNIIRYPHFYQLSRNYNGQEVNFYKHIEIDGELHSITDVWDSLPISKKVPKTVEFIKEYVIRRYILERDNGVQHKYPMRGSLLPFLTMFAPSDFYKSYGKPVELMRNCVSARVDFFRSRNPYLKRYYDVKQNLIPPYETVDCPFKQYCKQSRCVNICADYTEISYLMERNRLPKASNVFMASEKAFQNASEWLTAASNSYKVVIADNTSEVASRLSYVAICQKYKGNTLHCSVYHLNFSEYMNRLQQSWGKSDDDAFEYEQLFIAQTDILIISNIEFMQFKDFQAQTLFNIINNRKLNSQTSIVVTPKLESLSGSGTFFPRLKELLGKEVLN